MENPVTGELSSGDVCAASNPALPQSSTDAVVGAADHRRQPRLGVGHVILYTACVAIALTTRQQFDERFTISDDSSIGWRVQLYVPLFAWALTYGFALAAVPIMFARWRRAITFPVAPGEWLLVSNGFVQWTMAAIVVTAPLSRVEVYEIDVVVNSVPATLKTAVVVVTLAIGAARLMSSPLWSICFASWAVASAVIGVARLLGMMNIEWFTSPNAFGSVLITIGTLVILCGWGVSSIFFCIAAARDISQRIRRGWMHWLGVAFVVAILLCTILQITLEIAI